MIRNAIGSLWRFLPGWFRLQIIRATQQKFTVSAAAIVTNGDGKVLLLEHVLRPFSGWGLPGGFLGAGEQPEDAIRREVREETGIELERLRMISVRTVGRHIEILFRAESSGEPEVKSREILELGWFDTAAMPEKMSTVQEAIVRQVLNGEFDNRIDAV